MKRFNHSFVSLGILLFAFLGCAHGAMEQNLDAKLAQETAVHNRTDLRKEATQLVKLVPGLSEEQRTKLSNLRESTRVQMDDLSTRSLRLRSLMLKDLLSATDNGDELDLIKQRLKDVENSRLNLILSSVEEASRILGKEASQHREFMEDFWLGHSEMY